MSVLDVVAVLVGSAIAVVGTVGVIVAIFFLADGRRGR